MSKPAYKRVLIKISGEALAIRSDKDPDISYNIDFTFLTEVCKTIKKCVDAGVEVGIVVGGGNFWRGVKNGSGKLDRSKADQMGMLATIMNALAMSDVLNQLGVDARVQTAMSMTPIAEPYSKDKANRYLKKGKVVIFGGGTGNPFFSTDTGAALRAAEIGADILLLAKNVDGVYDSDPGKNPNAKKYDNITYSEVLAKHLDVMDMTATSLAMDNNIPVMVFEVSKPENMYNAIMGEHIGTVVAKEFN